MPVTRDPKWWCHSPDWSPGSNTLWLFNIAMGNGPFIEVYILKMVIFHGYVSHNQMVFLFGTIMKDHGMGIEIRAKPRWYARESNHGLAFGFMIGFAVSLEMAGLGFLLVDITFPFQLRIWYPIENMELLILSTPSLVFTIQFLISFIYYHLVI